MADRDGPYISADKTLPELTIRALVLGVILGAFMTAANTYLGLYIGMTVSASIPAAVMSMLALRLFRFKDVNILENNIVQTMTSAGESLAAGVIFTMPALLVMGHEMDLMTTFIVAVLGGVLGTIFTITLRRVFIVEEALLYPEGIACEEVLIAGEKGGSSLIVILYALGLGAIYGWFVKGFEITQTKVYGAVDIIGDRLYLAADLSLALVSVGYIVGLRIASYIFLGAVIGVVLITPIYGLVHGWPSGFGVDVAHGFESLWLSQIRFVGVGCMVVGGIWTLWSMRKTIIKGILKVRTADLSGGDDAVLRTEQDLPMNKMAIVIVVIIVLTFLFYYARLYTEGASLLQAGILAIVGSLFLAFTAFFFSAVAGYIAGVVGSSNSPVSGMTIATLMATSLIVWIVGDLILGMETDELMYATLLIASIVAVNAAIAGDVMQDLKTGHLVGATPWRQQIAEIIGVIVGAIIAPLTLQVLNEVYRITPTYCAENPHPELGCTKVLAAPQAEIIGTLIEGIFGGSVNYPMIVLGALIAVLIIWKGLPVMSVAIGMYLPFYLSATIFLGGLLSHFVIRAAHLRIDGTLSGEPSDEAKEAGAKISSRGLLLSAGMIAGEAIMGVLIALLIISGISPGGAWGLLKMLGPTLSLGFFAWFFFVFTWLATRTMPESPSGKGNLVLDWIAVAIDGVRRFVSSLKPPESSEGALE